LLPKSLTVNKRETLGKQQIHARLLKNKLTSGEWDLHHVLHTSCAINNKHKEDSSAFVPLLLFRSWCSADLAVVFTEAATALALLTTNHRVMLQGWPSDMNLLDTSLGILPVRDCFLFLAFVGHLKSIDWCLSLDLKNSHLSSLHIIPLPSSLLILLSEHQVNVFKLYPAPICVCV
jgi:hypothetical protein